MWKCWVFWTTFVACNTQQSSQRLTKRETLASHLLPSPAAKASHGDLERGHSRTSRRRHIFAAAGRPAPNRPLCNRVRNGVQVSFWPLGENIWNGLLRKRGANLIVPAGPLGVSLQEVNAAPVRFISDLLAEDTWSHVFMDTLAPRGFVKVRHHRSRVQHMWPNNGFELSCLQGSLQIGLFWPLRAKYSETLGNMKDV